MSTVIVIPLADNKDLAELVADKQPGDKLYACGSIKAKDEQSLTLRIQEVTDKRDELPDLDKPDEEDDMDEDEGEEDSNGSTEGESEEAADLASPGIYGAP